MQSTEEEAGELKKKCAYFKGLVDFLENQVKNVRNEVERQEAELAKLWEQIDGEMAAAKDLHDQEMAVAAARHAQEMAAAKDLHDQEMAAAAARHAQEMVAAKDLHDQEMAAATARHAQEMAAVKREYSLEYLENMGQPPAEAFSDSDTNQFLNLDEKLGCSSAEMKNVVWAP